jgi:Predicted membrane protein (DUF2243)
VTGETGQERTFPLSAGIFLGLGLGGFFDGIVLHQLLQWHHMLTSAGYPPDSIHNLQVNTFWDGLFHASTYIFVVLGVALLWRAARRRHFRWSNKTSHRHDFAGFRHFQPGGRHHKPPSAGHSPRERDGSPRTMGLLGPRLPGLGCRDAGRGLDAAPHRTGDEPSF